MLEESVDTETEKRSSKLKAKAIWVYFNVQNFINSFNMAKNKTHKIKICPTVKDPW